jgi:hypothetical protein
MFALIYQVIYILVNVLYLMDLLKTNIYLKDFNTFYKSDINNNIMSNIVVHPFYVSGKAWMDRMSLVDKVLRKNFDVESLTGYYLYVLFKFVLIIWTFLFLYGILRILVDMGGVSTTNTFRTQGVERYMTLIMCVLTVFAWFFLTSVVKTVFKSSKDGKKISENSMTLYVILITMIISIVYYLVIMNIVDDDNGFSELILFDAIDMFELKIFYQIVLIHMGMCLVFIGINTIQKTFYQSKNIDKTLNKTKMIIIAMCMNLGVLGLNHFY